MKQLSVLVVEDNAPMMDVLVAMLDKFGFGQILTASEGEQAFSMFQGHKPDLIITDWHMDGVDGLELTQWIRRSKYSVNRQVPIILLTGYSEHFRVASARDTGITEILAKPFSANDLARRIMHVIDRPRDFIEAMNFFGPDRRRRPEDGFSGKNRRNVDPEAS